MDDQANKINQDNIQKVPIEKTEEVEEKKVFKIEKENIINQKEASIDLGKIAIVIDDFGYRNDDVSDGFLEIPQGISMESQRNP